MGADFSPWVFLLEFGNASHGHSHEIYVGIGIEIQFPRQP